VATYPLGPVMEGAGLNVTVLSYLGMDFGFMACAELVPDVWDLAEHIETSMAERLAAAKGATRATGARG
jgi:diacylglycerol O-acyltransferase / wax synthase